jgi:hypothetical protein
MAVPRPTAGGNRRPGNELHVSETPLPLPVVLAGPLPESWQLGDQQLDPFGGGPVPVRVAGTAAVLPVLGRGGILLDLRTAQQVLTDAGFIGTYQVWLAGDAPAGIVRALTAAGLSVVTDDTRAVRSRELAQQGPAVAARFRLLLAAIGLLLAAALLALAAQVDSGPRLAQLRALRTQGLSRPTAVVVGYAGYAALVVAGVAGGLLAAVVADRVAKVEVLGFTDGWQILHPPSTLPPGTVAVAGLAALVLLGLTGWLSAAPLIRRLRATGGTAA